MFVQSCTMMHVQHDTDKNKVSLQMHPWYVHMCVCYVVCPFILDVRLVDVPNGVTQEEGHTGFIIHLPSAVLALIFLARRIQPFLLSSIVKSIFCVLTK